MALTPGNQNQGHFFILCFDHTLLHSGLGNILANGGDVQPIKAHKHQQNDDDDHQCPQGQKPYAFFFVVQNRSSRVLFSVLSYTKV